MTPRKTYILGVLYNHAHRLSLQRALRRRGFHLMDQGEAIRQLEQSGRIHDRFQIVGILLPAAEPRTSVEWLALLLRVPIVAELDLAQILLKAPIIAVTGTDGKTSTSEMIERGLRACAERAELFVEFERSVLEAADDRKTWAVAETWSSQLESTEKFFPRVAVLLNIKPDHLDHHRDWKTYRDSKANVFLRQTENDHLVFNFDCTETRKIVRLKAINQHLWPISRKPLPKRWKNAVFLSGKDVVVRKLGRDHVVTTIEFWSDLGIHMESNRLAAIGVAAALGLSSPRLRKFETALRDFRPRPHRQEILFESKDLLVVNDSKSTNWNAAKSAIERFAPLGTVLWITGGSEKNLPLSQFLRWAKRRIHSVIVLQSFQRLERELRSARVPWKRVSTMKEALEQTERLARRIAKRPVIVLFAPLGAALPPYEDYTERGLAFRRAARRLF